MTSAAEIAPSATREFAWTDEHHDLRRSVRGMLEDVAPLARARELGEAGERHDPSVWATLGTAGLLSLVVPESRGGSGGDLVDLALVAEEFGRVLYGGPYLASAVLATHVLLGSPDDELLTGLLSGERTATLAVVEGDGSWAPEAIETVVRGPESALRLSGTKVLVLDGAGAEVLLVAAREERGISLFAVEGESGVTRIPLTPLDLTRPVARVVLDEAPARRVSRAGKGWPMVERALAVARIFLAAEQVGAGSRAVEITADYARERHQFGRPVGSFQGVKHRLAEMHVRAELARSAAYWAAWRTDAEAVTETGPAIRIAAHCCAESCLRNALDMIQLHGGIGFTWEHDAHLFLRRARSTLSLLGQSSEHRAELFDALTEEARL